MLPCARPASPRLASVAEHPGQTRPPCKRTHHDGAVLNDGGRNRPTARPVMPDAVSIRGCSGILVPDPRLLSPSYFRMHGNTCFQTSELPDARKYIEGPMIVTVASHKGGVGKTTTAVHLAAYLQTLAERNS